MSRYTLGEELGRGGMATVFRAEDREDDTEVAIKLLHPHLSGDAAMVEAFYREAELMKSLKSPGVVSVYETTEIDGRPAIVMELLEGGTVRQLSARQEKLSEEQALEVVKPVLEVLSEAHDQGIVHRDIKPGNILLDGQKVPRLIDFGISQAEELVALANAGQIGTVEYMAPERIDGLAIDGRSDLYSVGVMLFELLCGHLPYRADSASAVMKMHRNAEVPDPSFFAPELSPHISRAIQIALAKHPEERFHNADEMLAMLEGRANIGDREKIAEHRRWRSLIESADMAELMAAPVEEEGYEWVVFVPRPDEVFQRDSRRKFTALRSYLLDHSRYLQIPVQQAEEPPDESLKWTRLMQHNGVARGLSRLGAEYVVEALDAADIPSRHARRSRRHRHESRLVQLIGGSQVGNIMLGTLLILWAAFFLIAREGYAGSSPPAWLDPAFIVFTITLGLSLGWFGTAAMAREFWYCRFSRAFLLDFCAPKRAEMQSEEIIGGAHLRLARQMRSSRVRASFEGGLNISLHLLDFLEDSELPGRQQVEAAIEDLTALARELVDVEQQIAHLRPGELIGQIRALDRQITVAESVDVAESVMEQKSSLQEQLKTRDKAQARLQILAQRLLELATDLDALLRQCRGASVEAGDDAEEPTVLDFASLRRDKDEESTVAEVVISSTTGAG